MPYAKPNAVGLNSLTDSLADFLCFTIASVNAYAVGNNPQVQSFLSK